MVVGDMPFGSYEVNPEAALRTAIRFVKVFEATQMPWLMFTLSES